MQEFPLEQPLVVDATFSVAGVPTDPTTVTFTVEQPDGSLEAFSWPPDAEVYKISDGVFKAQFTPTLTGLHAYRMVATGTATGVLEDVFNVTSRVYGNMLILTTPEDYEGVRYVLGVTELDVSNTVIESRPYGPIAEATVAGDISDWAAVKEDVLSDAPAPIAILRWQFIVAAVQYTCASLIANTMARGGFVGLVRGEGRRDAAEWAKYAQELWVLGQQYAGQASEGSGEEISDMSEYMFPIFMVSSPSRNAQSPWALYQTNYRAEINEPQSMPE